MSITSIPFLFLAFVMFCVVSQLLRHRANHQEEANRDDLMNAERIANETRAVDLSEIEYLKFTPDLLPFGSDIAEIRECENPLLALADRRILNLNNLTNTEIKARYGAANLEALSSYDENYSELIIGLNRWGQALKEAGQTENAICVLSYAVHIGSDIKASYLTLGDLYFSQGQFDQIDQLIERAEELDSLSKGPILNALRSY